jgi:hypothetical protein
MAVDECLHPRRHGVEGRREPADLDRSPSTGRAHAEPSLAQIACGIVHRAQRPADPSREGHRQEGAGDQTAQPDRRQTCPHRPRAVVRRLLRPGEHRRTHRFRRVADRDRYGQTVVLHPRGRARMSDHGAGEVGPLRARHRGLRGSLVRAGQERHLVARAVEDGGAVALLRDPLQHLSQGGRGGPVRQVLLGRCGERAVRRFGAVAEGGTLPRGQGQPERHDGQHQQHGDQRHDGQGDAPRHGASGGAACPSATPSRKPLP